MRRTRLSAGPVAGGASKNVGVDKVIVIDQGNGTGQSGVSRFASNAPSVIFGLLQQLEAMGLNVPTLLSQLGVKYQNENGASTKPEPVAAESETKSSDSK
jgi:hypothetical protein